jgi:pimeloyl-ACP methyl ester carboxylesterase
MDQSVYQVAEVNGAKLRYDVQGQGEPIVLIHSALGDLVSWDDQIADFSSRYKVVRYDVRGWGRSTGPETGYAEYEDLRALLDYLGIARAALVGCSYGGGIAIDFALACPDRVTGLVPVGPALGGHESPPDEPVDALRREMMEAYQRGDMRRAAELTARTWVDGPGRSPDQVDPEFRRRALEMIAATYALPDRDQPPWLQPPAAGRLGEIHSPLLVLVGEHDISGMQARARLIAEQAPDAQLTILKDTAHLPNMEHPEAFNRAVLDFLTAKNG